MQRILDPATGSRARANLVMVEKVEAVDPLTVRFTLNIPYAGFPDIFGERQLRILAKDRDRQDLDEAGRHRAVRVQVVVARRPPGAREEPRLFREGPAQARRRHHAHHPRERGARRGASNPGADRHPLEPALRDGRQVQEPSERARRRRRNRHLGRRDPQQRAPTLQRCARAPGARGDHRQGGARRAGAVRPGRADPQPDPAEPSLFQQGAAASRSPTSPRPRSCWPRRACRTASR